MPKSKPKKPKKEQKWSGSVEVSFTLELMEIPAPNEKKALAIMRGIAKEAVNYDRRVRLYFDRRGNTTFRYGKPDFQAENFDFSIGTVNAEIGYADREDE